MGLLVVASNGEIIRLGTGEVLGLDSEYYLEHAPQLSTDAQTLMRRWDGMSAEPLGSVPKIIALSRAEEKLLSRLHPWRWFKYATRMDYLKLLDKMNRHKLSLNRSIIMKNLWKNPDSVFNSPEYLASLRGPRGPSPHSSLMMIKRWQEPIFRAKMIKILCDRVQTDEWRNKTSELFTRLWADPEYRTKRIAEYLVVNSARAIKGWETRKENYPTLYKDPEATHKRMSEAQSKTAKERWAKRVKLYGPTGCKNHELTNQKKKEAWAWRKLAMVFQMIFSVSPSI